MTYIAEYSPTGIQFSDHTGYSITDLMANTASGLVCWCCIA